jgi:hypothetical protein
MRSSHLSKVDRGGLPRDRHSRRLEALINLNARTSVLLQRLDRLAYVSAPTLCRSETHQRQHQNLDRPVVLCPLTSERMQQQLL